MPPLPEKTASYRAQARDEDGPRRYAGWLHFAFTSLGSLTIIALAASQLRAVAPVELLIVPATFLFANLVEFLAHKGPMHHPTKGPLAILFKRHTGQHHRFFTHDAMEAESSYDFYWVLFPPVMLFFFLGVVAAPLAGVLFVVATPNLAWLYVLTAMSYFLTYEWLHFAYHQPPESLIGRLPLVGALRRHHMRHHDQRLMSAWNFNITFPICDALFGTTWSEERAEARRVA